MFKKTDPNPQLDMFTAPVMQLGSRASKKYSDPKAWHNQFHSFVTTKIDEEIFRPLFPEGKKSGRPNASIRVLVSMSVLKEGYGCSDEDLFEKCEFDLLTRKALGLELLTDVTPSIDTYYLFRRRICEYQEKTGVDLMQKCFEQISGEQVRMLKISGKCVRMDSKLIGSNIARQSRYELIHTTLVKFLKSCTLSNLSPEQAEQAKAYMEEDSSKTVYRSDADTLQSNLASIGNFIMEVLAAYPASSPARDLLDRLFGEQYVIADGKAVLRDKKEIKADSLQNPNDPDASFRDKNDQKVQGYVTNITETVEDGKPSIITSVQVETAVFADCHFLQEAVENSERVTKSTIEDLYADGAYQSPENRKFAKYHDDMQLKTGKMQGGCRWELIPHDEDGLTVREIETSNTYEAVKAVTKQGTRKRWRIPWNNKTGWRYFEDKDIEAYKLRKQIESLPPEEQRRRNNVEAAMFQYSFHTRNGKTRYRGLLKHRIHAYSRCMWMNLRRMVIFHISTFQRPIFALFGSLREAFGMSAAIFKKIFTIASVCCDSPRMTVMVRLNFKYASF
jgi:IS5 family transposase